MGLAIRTFVPFPQIESTFEVSVVLEIFSGTRISSSLRLIRTDRQATCRLDKISFEAYGLCMGYTEF